MLSSTIKTNNIIINGEKTPIYLLDTIESIKIRLSSRLSLLPNLIQLSEIKEVDVSTKIVAGCKAINLKNKNITENDEITSSLNNRSFTMLNFIDECKTKIYKAGYNKKKQLDVANDIINMFNLEDFKQYCIYLLYFVFGDINKFQNTLPDIKFVLEEIVKDEFGSFNYIVNEFEMTKDNIKNNVDMNILNYKKDIKLFESYNSSIDVYKEIETSSVQFDKTSISVKFDISTDIYEVFNKLLLSRYVPFACVGDFYKMLKSFKPPKSWAIKYEKEDLLVMYVYNRYVESERNKIKPDSKNYSPVFIYPISVNKENYTTTVEMIIESRIDDELKEENLIERIFSSFPLNIKECVYEQNKVEADYIFPAPCTLEIPLFFDMVMNDPIISQLMVIDERIRTFRERGGIFTYFRYNSHVNPKNFMSCRINIGNVESLQQSRAPRLFSSLGGLYISVKMFSVPSSSEALFFRNIINKILQYYFDRKDLIKLQYSYLLPDINKILQSFEVREDSVVVRNKMLKDYDPRIFVSGYRRVCDNQPTILETEDEINEAVANSRDIMYFPLFGESQQRAYVCDYSSYPFVGLKSNKKLKNQAEFPYVPCCYSKDQKNNSKKNRYKYENEIKEEEIESFVFKGKKSTVFISNKALPRSNDSYGLLPELIDKLLRTIDPKSFPVTEKNKKFVRTGTLRDKNSVLDAVIMAINDFYYYLSKVEKNKDIKYKQFISSRLPGGILSDIFSNYELFDNDKKSSYLDSIRKELVNYINANTTAQSTYDMETQTLKDYLFDENSYLDIKLIWRILEEVFNINIYLFQRTEENPRGVLGSPKFVQEYLQYKKSISSSNNPEWRITILLFETIGSEFDVLRYPQVELIKSMENIGESDGNVIVKSFSWFGKDNKIFLPRLQKCFNDIYSWGGHANLPVPNFFESKPIGQCSDLYGKIRFIQFANNICIMTEPIPPIDKDEMLNGGGQPCNFIPVSYDKAMEFIQLENVSKIKQVVINNKIVGLRCKKFINSDKLKNNLNFYIPIEEMENMNLYKTAPPVAPTFNYSVSLLDEFNRLSKLARYINEYVLWIFSRWHLKTNGDITSNDYLKLFAENNFIISNNHEYPSVIPRRFDTSLPGLTSNGKLYVPSSEIRNRLIYSVKININQNRANLLDYHSRTYINNYYKDITDFDIQDNYIILFGQNMVLNWISTKLVSNHELYDRIIHPYDVSDIKELEEDRESVEKEDLISLISNKQLLIDPYFIKLYKFDVDNVYLVQQASSISHALYICKNWIENGYNPGFNSIGKLSTNVPFKYIVYNSEDDYKVYDINDENSEYIVLQYKYKGQIFTMSLLKFQ